MVDSSFFPEPAIIASLRVATISNRAPKIPLGVNLTARGRLCHSRNDISGFVKTNQLGFGVLLDFIYLCKKIKTENTIRKGEGSDQPKIVRYKMLWLASTIYLARTSVPYSCNSWTDSKIWFCAS